MKSNSTYMFVSLLSLNVIVLGLIHVVISSNSLIPFCCRVVFHYVNVIQRVYSFTLWWILSLFPVSTAHKAVWTSLHKSLRAQMLSSNSPCLILTTDEWHSTMTTPSLSMRKLRPTTGNYPTQGRWLIGLRANNGDQISPTTPGSRSPWDSASPCREECLHSAKGRHLLFCSKNVFRSLSLLPVMVISIGCCTQTLRGHEEHAYWVLLVCPSTRDKKTSQRPAPFPVNNMRLYLHLWSDF